VDQKQSWLSEIKSLLPGYSAYQSQESRREDDRLTRSYLVKRIDQCKSQLDRLGLQAAQSGDMDLMMRSEKMRTELDRGRSRLAAAVEGYAGWFNRSMVDQQMLEQVSQLDANLVSLVDWIAQHLDQRPLPEDKLNQSIELLHQRIDRRWMLLKQE
jgi:hypothetical protein